MERLNQKTFDDKVVPEEVTWDTMVFLQKKVGGYQGIGLVEAVWKVCATVVSYHLKRSGALHDALHRFRVGRGTGTATLEDKWASHCSRFSWTCGRCMTPYIRVCAWIFYEDAVWDKTRRG